jgi:hypothetical protein
MSLLVLFFGSIGVLELAQHGHYLAAAGGFLITVTVACAVSALASDDD